MNQNPIISDSSLNFLDRLLQFNNVTAESSSFFENTISLIDGSKYEADSICIIASCLPSCEFSILSLQFLQKKYHVNMPSIPLHLPPDLLESFWGYILAFLNTMPEIQYMLHYLKDAIPLRPKTQTLVTLMKIRDPELIKIALEHIDRDSLYRNLDTLLYETPDFSLYTMFPLFVEYDQKLLNILLENINIKLNKDNSVDKYEVALIAALSSVKIQEFNDKLFISNMVLSFLSGYLPLDSACFNAFYVFIERNFGPLQKKQDPSFKVYFFFKCIFEKFSQVKDNVCLQIEQLAKNNDKVLQAHKEGKEVPEIRANTKLKIPALTAYLLYDFVTSPFMKHKFINLIIDDKDLTLKTNFLEEMQEKYKANSLQNSDSRVNDTSDSISMIEIGLDYIASEMLISNTKSELVLITRPLSIFLGKDHAIRFKYYFYSALVTLGFTESHLDFILTVIQHNIHYKTSMILAQLMLIFNKRNQTNKNINVRDLLYGLFILATNDQFKSNVNCRQMFVDYIDKSINISSDSINALFEQGIITKKTMQKKNAPNEYNQFFQKHPRFSKEDLQSFYKSCVTRKIKIPRFNRAIINTELQKLLEIESERQSAEQHQKEVNTQSKQNTPRKNTRASPYSTPKSNSRLKTQKTPLSSPQGTPKSTPFNSIRANLYEREGDEDVYIPDFILRSKLQKEARSKPVSPFKSIKSSPRIISNNDDYSDESDDTLIKNIDLEIEREMEELLK